MSVLAVRTIKRLYNKHLNKKTINKLLPTQSVNECRDNKASIIQSSSVITDK